MKLFDSHAHISFEHFSEEEWPHILERSAEAGVSCIMNISTDSLILQRAKTLTALSSPVTLFHAAATPPHNLTSKEDPFFDEITQTNLNAIGETGLDYFHNPETKPFQIALFSQYIQLAIEKRLPLIVHCRDAFNDLFDILPHPLPIPTILHCFTGTMEDAKKLLDLGWYISLSGIITYPKNEELRRIASFIPVDRLLIETDAPYLAPQPKRGKRNEPAFLTYTAETLAVIKKVAFEEITQASFDNAWNLFSRS